MTQISEVAKYFLKKEQMSHKKLQKICYYAQAWYLANFGDPLMPSVFEAWVHGPVSPELYYVYRDWGWLPIRQDENVIPNIDNKTASFLDLVYNVYGSYSGDELEQFTHQELPWKKARIGYSPSEYCRVPISQNDMKNYYGSRLANSK